MNIDGICLKKYKDNTILCKIETFSDEVKQTIRNEILSIAHGETAQYFSYQNTLRQLIEIYGGNKNRIKGMIGELLAHILINKELENFDSMSCLMNLEENSFKKGFDIVYYCKEDHEMWYTEVKSGSTTPKKRTSTQGTITLLKRAKSDLKNKIINNDSKLWQNAINHAYIKAATSHNIKEILQMLSDARNANPKLKENYKNVILTSVLYYDTSSEIDYNIVDDFHASLKNSPFQKIIIFAIHKNTYLAVKNFIYQEAGYDV